MGNGRGVKDGEAFGNPYRIATRALNYYSQIICRQDAENAREMNVRLRTRGETGAPLDDPVAHPVCAWRIAIHAQRGRRRGVERTPSLYSATIDTCTIADR